MEGQKNNAAATDGMEAKRPGEGPINKTKSMRRELSAILQEHNDGELMKVIVLARIDGQSTSSYQDGGA